MPDALTKEQEKQCKNAVRKFLNDSSMELHVEPDMRQIQLCFRFLKQAVLIQQKQKLKAKELSENRKELLQCEHAKKEKEEKIGICFITNILAFVPTFSRNYFS